jgi:ubiquinone/menaquinone biosynthesis C-methylase UbiE
MIGIDADSVGIEFARQKALENGLANVRFMVSKSDTLPFAPNDFDVTLMTDVIEYLPRPGDLLAEIVRVLKPGGVAITTITTPNRQDASKWDERHDREYTGPELSSELAAPFKYSELGCFRELRNKVSARMNDAGLAPRKGRQR